MRGLLSGPRRTSAGLSGTLEVPAQPRRSWALSLPPSCEIFSTANVQLFLSRMYEPAGGCRGQSEASPTGRTQHGPTSAATALVGAILRGLNRSIHTDRKALEARLLQGPRRLLRSADAACSLRARPGAEEPSSERECVPFSGLLCSPTPAERDRDAPSAPVVLPRTALGRSRRRPPLRGTCADGAPPPRARSGDSFSQTL